jgi:GMP synthase (glutamine-hydrolysing)
MRVAIVENMRETDHGQVGRALAEAGAAVEVFRPFADGGLPSAGAHDGLVVFGGEQSALDDERHAWLPGLARLMHVQATAGGAVLGICLGAQLLARGAGALNLLGAAPEFGWCDVELTAEGQGDPVLSALPDRFPIFQWHTDTFTLPPGAAHLAAGVGSGAPQQAFRFGARAYGTQFHFEADRAVVARWSRDYAPQAEAMRPGWAFAHAAEATRHGAAADAAGLALARAWVGLLGSQG